ncbi:hypothetical protein NEMBOFW57_000124 [Staphylotrichum longicolle]|uniref:Uncharacterized protein n=1 Tax=Staphylotrichum longicolle TaxID=669026 RepID=A0AAD4EZ26_9PEZI|nr:hypothetical protein NEMBOFW57_000124 [Staphylotrichum longicolle]
MVTKAGVPASKILAGLPHVRLPLRRLMCTYTGTNISFNAYKGRFTDAAGDISNTEIEEIIKDNAKGYPFKRVLFDSAFESNILVCGTQAEADYVGDMQNVAEHTGRVGANPVDNNGEAYYRIGDTGKESQVRVIGKGQREYKCLEKEVPVTLVITGSNDYGFITSPSFGLETDPAPIGQSGEHLDKVVDNINRFTSEQPGEVIILQSRYLIGIRNASLKSRTVGRLMSSNGGKGCVLIFLDTAHLQRNIAEPDRLARPDGTCDKGDLRWTDGWPETDNTKAVAEFNVDKWAQNRDDVLVSQWLSTPNPFTSTFVYGLQPIAVLRTNPGYEGPVRANLASSNHELSGLLLYLLC